MSCIAIVRTEPQIVFASDAVAYGADGKLRGFCSKFIPMIELECVFGSIGIGGLTPALRCRLDQRFTDFDHLLDHIVDEFFQTFERLLSTPLHQESKIDGTATLAIGGWSKSRKRFETYKIHSFVKEGTDLDGGKHSAASWMLHPMQDRYCSNWPGKETATKFGLMSDAPMTDDEMAVRYVCANRAGHVAGSDEHEGVPYAVGGFVHLTTLWRDNDEPHIDSRIVHRWPDVIGEAVDPKRGEPLPAFRQPSAQ